MSPTVGVGREEFVNESKAKPFVGATFKARWVACLPARRFRDGSKRVMGLDTEALSSHAKEKAMPEQQPQNIKPKETVDPLPSGMITT